MVEELRKAQAELYDLHERLRAAEDVLARTEIRAPLAGTVVDLRVHSAGGGAADVDLGRSADRRGERPELLSGAGRVGGGGRGGRGGIGRIASGHAGRGHDRNRRALGARLPARTADALLEPGVPGVLSPPAFAFGPVSPILNPGHRRRGFRTGEASWQSG